MCANEQHCDNQVLTKDRCVVNDLADVFNVKMHICNCLTIIRYKRTSKKMISRCVTMRTDM